VADPVTVAGEPGAVGRDEPEDDEGLNAVELRVADMIAAGCTVDETAKETGKSIRTIRRWKKDPKIAAVIKARASEAVAMGRAVLSSGMHRASRALVQMADGSTLASAPRVSAARAVVETTAKLVELEELQARLAELEAQIGQQPGQPGFGRGNGRP
jgi:hypothetical protein